MHTQDKYKAKLLHSGVSSPLDCSKHKNVKFAKILGPENNSIRSMDGWVINILNVREEVGGVMQVNTIIMRRMVIKAFD